MTIKRDVRFAWYETKARYADERGYIRRRDVSIPPIGFPLGNGLNPEIDRFARHRTPKRGLEERKRGRRVGGCGLINLFPSLRSVLDLGISVKIVRSPTWDARVEDRWKRGLRNHRARSVNDGPGRGASRSDTEITGTSSRTPLRGSIDEGK